MKRPLCLSCLALILFIAVWYRLHPPQSFSYEEAAGREVGLTGYVCAKEYKQGNSSPFLVLSVKPQSLCCDSKTIPFKDNIICKMRSMDEEPAMGSFVHLKGKLVELEPATNPGQFDERVYYNSLGISVRIIECSLISESDSYNKVTEWLWRIRKSASAMFQKCFSKEDAAILSAMLLGDKQGIPPELKELYKNAGILHILAISGLHIFLLGMGFLKLLQKLPIPIVLANIISGVAMILYGFMVGMPVSCIRAVGMFLIRLLALCIGRTYDMITALFVCAAFTIIQEPRLLDNSGFWLSYMAVLSILVWKPVVCRDALESIQLVKNRFGKKKKSEVNFNTWIDKGFLEKIGKCMDKLKDGFLTSISITLFTLPVQLTNFFSFSLLSPVLNLFILPLAGVILFLGILCLFFSYFLFPVSDCLSLGIHLILVSFRNGCELLYILQGEGLTPGIPGIWNIFLYYGIFLIIAKSNKLRLKFRIGLLCGALLLLTLHPQKGLTVTFLDVGQGDCAVMELPDGKVWIIDCGSSTKMNVGTYYLEPFLRSKGITTVDAVFMSHEDDDHIGGLNELIENRHIKVKMLVLPYREENKRDNFSKTILLTTYYKIPVLWLNTGMTFDSGEVSTTCLYPEKEKQPTDKNASSQVLLIRYNTFSILFTGDLEKEGEEEVTKVLIERGIQDIDILKVAHHGSKNSSTEEFLEQVNPKLAVISCGKKNRYGHPHKELLNRLSQKGCYMLRTNQSGAVTINISDQRISVQEFCR